MTAWPSGADGLTLAALCRTVAREHGLSREQIRRQPLCWVMQCWLDLQREHARQELAQLQAFGVAASAAWGGEKAGRAYERRQEALLRVIRGRD